MAVFALELFLKCFGGFKPGKDSVEEQNLSLENVYVPRYAFDY